MHEYKLTGRPETDNCLKLANKAHNFYFKDVLSNKCPFISASKDFYSAIEKKFISKNRGKNLDQALKNLFKTNYSKYEFFTKELNGIKETLDVLAKKNNLVNANTKFILDYIARFMELILPYACSVKDEVDGHRKFNYEKLVSSKMTFFRFEDQEKNKGKYLTAFYASAWRSQKNLNGTKYLKEHLEKRGNTDLLKDPFISEFYHENGSDYLSTLMFARIANEQFLKYKTNQKLKYPNNDSIEIKIPNRIADLKENGAINELIACQAKIVNSRGNNIAHQGFSCYFSTCYHCLELLNYYAKYCI